MKTEISKQTCIVALSGGIDSSVALHLLIQENKYNLICVFMKNWDELTNFEDKEKSTVQQCNWYEDYNYAKKISAIYSVPFYMENFEQKYWDLVFNEMLKKYLIGQTPNPDILCNKMIKFSIFKEYVLNKYNGDYLATGHYATIKKYKDQKFLLTAKDLIKDQTYFLADLTSQQLNNVIFPLHSYQKDEVFKIGRTNNFPNINKKESTGMCFIGERKFNNFLKNYLPIKNGNIINFDTNKIIGQHEGLWFYTIGQRKKLNIFKNNIKYFVYKKDMKKNILYVLEKDSPLLVTNILKFSQIHFINSDFITKKTEIICHIKVKHSFKFYLGKLDIQTKTFYLSDKKIPNVSPGQYGVFYQENRCLGNGIFI